MLNRSKLNGKIAESGLTKAELAKKLGITPKTFTSKMQKGVFGTDEVFKMVELLKIDDPVAIFLAK